ncbi:MAG: CoA synthetase, partial [Rhodospirillales bacterium]|nr:CoA synthetase [Rhodospirillales bacterium]
MSFQFQSVDELAARVFDGAKIAIPSNRAGVPMELARALVRGGVKDVHLVTVPAAGMQVDFMIGAGCVGTIETSGVSLDEFGVARRFMDAV